MSPYCILYHISESGSDQHNKSHTNMFPRAWILSPVLAPRWLDWNSSRNTSQTGVCGKPRTWGNDILGRTNNLILFGACWTGCSSHQSYNRAPCSVPLWPRPAWARTICHPFLTLGRERHLEATDFLFETGWLELEDFKATLGSFWLTLTNQVGGKDIVEIHERGAPTATPWMERE
jgi:hypothetical protein